MPKYKGTTMSISALSIKWCKLSSLVTFLCTHNLLSRNVHLKPFYVHKNQFTQILNLLSPVVKQRSITWFFSFWNLHISVGFWQVYHLENWRRKVNIIFAIWIFFKIGIYSIQGWTATTRHGVTRKRNTKRLRHVWNRFRRNLQLKDVC